MAHDDLDDVVRRADPDRWLSSRFIGERAARADVVALYAFDHELDRALRVTSNDLIAEMRLAWWREALDEIRAGGRVRSHPVAERLTTAVRGRGLPLEPFEAMVDGRIGVIEPGPLTRAQALAYAGAVGASTARLAALILDPATDAGAATPAGALWALSRLLASGRAEAGTLVGAMRQALPNARAGAGRLSVKAFPAIAHVALAREAPGRPLARRGKLILSVLRGRI